MVRSGLTVDTRGKGREDRILLTINSKNRDFFFCFAFEKFGVCFKFSHPHFSFLLSNCRVYEVIEVREALKRKRNYKIPYTHSCFVLRGKYQ